MKVLFCHDGPLRKDENGNYYGIAHNDKTFERYYDIAGKLTVAIRVTDISETVAKDKLSKITVSPFEVIEVSNISNIKGILLNKKNVKKKIKEAVASTDYVVARFPSLLGYLAFDEAKRQNKPCLVEVVACPWDAFWNHSLKGKLVAPFMYQATKNRVWHAKHVIYVTNKFLQERYPSKGENINCSNVALTTSNNEILENRLDKIEERKSKITIGTIGAVNVRYKGQQTIIKALGKLKKEGNTQYEYQLVGGGSQEYLMKMAKKHNVTEQVKFLGPLKHEKVFEWLDTLDIYAQPSKQEGLPRALIEAMSRAVPAIGANTAGIPELIENNFIFSNSYKNIDEICSILSRLSKAELIRQAQINFEESKKYKKETIENRRKNFFHMFKKQTSITR